MIRAFHKTSSREVIGAGGLFSLFLSCGMVMITQGAWTYGTGPGIASLANLNSAPENLALMCVTTFLAVVTWTTALCRQMHLFRAFVICLLLVPTVLVYRAVLPDPFWEAVFERDEEIRTFLAISGAALLVVPWVVPVAPVRKKLRHKTAGGLAFGTSALAVYALFLLFHLALLLPAWDQYQMDYEHAREMIEQTRGPEDLERLAQGGALDLQRLDSASATAQLHREGVSHLAGALESIEGVMQSGSATVEVWEVVGRRKFDLVLLVYDGRGETQDLWFLPAAAGDGARRAALSAFYVLFGFAAIAWPGLALLVQWFHRRIDR